MRIKNLFIGFIFTFPLVLVVSAFVGYCYSILVHGIGVTYWVSSFHLAIILGIAIPWIHEWEKHTFLRLDKSLYKILKKWASEDLRSVSAQIEFLLTDAVKKAGRLKVQEMTENKDS
jgi:hypothetical protein